MRNSAHLTKPARGGILLSVLLIALFTLPLVACDDQSNELPERQLERPIKAGFFCARRDEARKWRWDGMESCAADPTDTRYFAFIALSARGELAIVDLKDEKVVDLDPLNPGYNLLPVGMTLQDVLLDDVTGVIHVLASGPSRLVSVPVDSLLEMIRGETPTVPAATVPLVNGTAPVTSVPLHMEFHASSGELLITFPGCQAVGRFTVDGLLSAAWRISPSDPFLATADLADCPRESLDGTGSVDATPTELLPSTLALDGDALYVGVNSAGLSPAGTEPDLLLAVDLDAAGEPLVARQIVLDGETLGFGSLRVTPETRWGRFLYAVTRRGDVRVVRLSDLQECETQADTRELPALALDTPERGCVPVGSVPRAFVALTPGIHLAENRLIQDVTFFSRPENTDSQDPELKTTYLGIFGVATTWEGAVYVINLDEDFTESTFAFRMGPDSYGQSWPEEVQAHRFRNAVELNEGYATTGRPRMETPVTYYVSDLPTTATGGLPQLMPLDDGLFLHDLDGYFMRSETWNVIWDAVLPGTARSFGIADRDQSDAPEMVFYDVGANYCASGVQPGDVLRVVGCDSSDDCIDGYACGRTPMQRQDLPGLCFPREFAQEHVNACSRLLASDREFRVTGVWMDQLVVETMEYTDAEGQPVTCDADLDCREYGWVHGGICLKADGATTGVCAGAPWPELASVWCLGGTQKYEVRIDGSFLLSGSSTPYRPAFSTATDATCTAIPGAYDYRVPRASGDVTTPFFTFRISLDESVAIPVEYRMQFDILAGFGRVGKDISVRFPSWIGAGPDGYIYVTDMADSGGGTTYIGQFVRMLARTMALDTDFEVR
ncbi:hypothetical protein KKD52_10660 [Myxococcota bacterium]|nr:hypothetical protein [Myxococcota bacterium]MBU1413178.1 hypothetical protein [Myxococcota bacterium]MBU1510812.1 hypothetical protein [Myxococcota bacterium]